jgi:4-hydroxythreonine-4-phosphate dehydrogenase
MKKVAISVGDLNGIGIEIALKSHNEVKMLCSPIYCINEIMLQKASTKLGIKIPDDFAITQTKGDFEIEAGVVCKEAGEVSFASFIEALELVRLQKVESIVTLPINKESWSRAGIKYRGHTEYLREIFGENAIMMIGTSRLFVSFFTEHIPLRDVPESIKTKELTGFLIDLKKSISTKNIAVLGLNPHAGDGGVFGNEDAKIEKAIKDANRETKSQCFAGPFSADTAFTPLMRQKYSHYVSMYHDQSLGVVKALYFDEAINVTLNIPITRASVDHGTAYDIAYKNKKPSSSSYIEAIKYSSRK